MMVGPKHQKLEKRITRLLLSGKPYPREAVFLHQVSEQLLHRGREMHLSERLAERLFAILAGYESTVASNSSSTKPPVLPPSTARTISPSDEPRGVYVGEAMEPSLYRPPTSSIHALAVQTAPSLPTPTKATSTPLTRSPPVTPPHPSPATDGAKIQEPDFRKIMEQVFARNEARRQGKPELPRIHRFPST